MGLCVHPDCSIVRFAIRMYFHFRPFLDFSCQHAALDITAVEVITAA